MKTKARLGLLWASVTMLALPAVVQAQFDQMDNGDGTCTITGYSGSGGAVAITNTINDLVVTGIANWAFKNCTGLTGVTIPGSVTSIGDFAFIDCTNLTSVYFKGNAPGLGGMNVFKGDDKATIYYLPDKTGWGSSFGGRPTAPWNPQVRSNATSSVRSN